MAFNKFMLFSSRLSFLLECFLCCLHSHTLETFKSMGEGSPRMRPVRTHHTSFDELRFLRACLATFYFKKIYSDPKNILLYPSGSLDNSLNLLLKTEKLVPRFH